MFLILMGLSHNAALRAGKEGMMVTDTISECEEAAHNQSSKLIVIMD
jgi:hypothetical protein